MTIQRPMLEAIIDAAAIAAELPYEDTCALRSWAATATAFSGMFTHPDGPSCPLTASGVLTHEDRSPSSKEWAFVGGFDSACSTLDIFDCYEVVQVID